jgi:uncharacterized protein (TIGR04255 family)
MTRAVDLPEFDNPPVSEVVLSVQFDEIAGLKAAHLGLLWSLFRDDFPVTEDQPPLGAVFETFGPGSGEVRPAFRFPGFARMPLPRQWFVSADGTELLQFQTDRLAHNWRKTSSDGEYPRFEKLLTSFLDEISTVERFLADGAMPPLAPNQCEVTYVNDIRVEPSFDDSTRRLFKVWNHAPSDLLEHEEDAGFVIRFIMKDGPQPVGRLTVQSGRIIGQEGEPLVRFTLTARGAPLGPGIDGVVGFFNLAHRYIVTGFADLTTNEMHEVWGRRRRCT